MATGIALHIGLNYVDPNHYSGWDGKLVAAEFDANDMFIITKSQGFQSTKLLREAATRNAVISSISTAAILLKENDFFVISYSGHGGQIPDLNSDEDDDEDDGMDETWCLFDGQLVDDELSSLWSSFKNGVRILVISDSCHSGTVIKVARNIKSHKSKYTLKYMPDEISSKTYFNNKAFYDKIREGVKNVDSQDIQASVKLISGCQDDQYSSDGQFNGLFTDMLKKVWNIGKFNGSYISFHQQIMNLLPPEQTPNYYNIGRLNQTFENQKPFTI